MVYADSATASGPFRNSALHNYQVRTTFSVWTLFGLTTRADFPPSVGRLRGWRWFGRTPPQKDAEKKTGTPDGVGTCPSRGATAAVRRRAGVVVGREFRPTKIISVLFFGDHALIVGI